MQVCSVHKTEYPRFYIPRASIFPTLQTPTQASDVRWDEILLHTVTPGSSPTEAPMFHICTIQNMWVIQLPPQENRSLENHIEALYCSQSRRDRCHTHLYFIVQNQSHGLVYVPEDWQMQENKWNAYMPASATGAVTQNCQCVLNQSQDQVMRKQGTDQSSSVKCIAVK